MERLKKSFLRKLYITFLLFALVGCSFGKLPDEAEFMIKKYPELALMRESFSKKNLDPDKIDVSEDLNKKNFPSFIQWDDRWAYLPYNGSIMVAEGNIPTALSSIYCHYFNDKPINPYQMGQYFENNGWTVSKMGTSWNAIEKGSLYLGLKYKVISPSEIDMTNNLKKGNVLLASVGSGDFTEDSGLIIIYGKSGNKFKVSDPLSRKNSESLWDYKTLYDQIIHMWAFNKQ